MLPATDACLASQPTNLLKTFSVPSAIHLSDWIPSGSQLPGLSVGPYQTLSSLQRFYIAYTIPLSFPCVKV